MKIKIFISKRMTPKIWYMFSTSCTLQTIYLRDNYKLIYLTGIWCRFCPACVPNAHFATLVIKRLQCFVVNVENCNSWFQVKRRRITNYHVQQWAINFMLKCIFVIVELLPYLNNFAFKVISGLQFYRESAKILRKETVVILNSPFQYIWKKSS